MQKAKSYARISSTEDLVRDRNYSALGTGRRPKIPMDRKLKPKDFQAYMKTPRILDARRIYDLREFRELNYAAMGLGPAIPQQG